MAKSGSWTAPKLGSTRVTAYGAKVIGRPPKGNQGSDSSDPKERKRAAAARARRSGMKAPVRRSGAGETVSSDTGTPAERKRATKANARLVRAKLGKKK